MPHGISVTTPHPTPRPAWPALLLFVAAMGGAVLTLAYPSSTRQFTWPWILLLSGLWLAPIAAGFGLLLGRSSWTRPNALLCTGLGLLAAAILVAAALSPFASLSLLRVWPTLAGVILFFWLNDWLAEPEAGLRRAGAIACGIALFGALLACMSLAVWYAKSSGDLGLSRDEIPFGHSTYVAGSLLLILPWLVRAAFVHPGLQRAGWALAVAIALAALAATSSRSGVLAAATVAVLAAAVVVFRAPWSHRAKTLAVIGATGLFALAILANPRLNELVRHGAWGDSARESNTQRAAMLDAGLRLGAMRPFAGWGPGTVPLVYPKVRGLLTGGVDNVLQLHNSALQLWATTGGGGVAALFLLLAATGRRIAHTVRQPTSLAVTAASSVVAYGLFAFTDHQLDLPAMNALLILNLALLFQGAPGSAVVAWKPVARGVALTAAGIVLVPLLLLTGRDLFARSSYEQALTLFEHNRDADGMECLATAADWASYDPYYRQLMADHLLEQRFKTDDPATQARLTVAATAQLERSLTTGCLEEFAHFNLGWLALEAGQPARAAEHFIAVAHEAPHRLGVYFGLGLALRGTGNQRAAVRAFALEWLNDPMAFAAPVWEWPDFVPLRPDVEREADLLITGLIRTQPTALYVRDLWIWWAEGTRPARGYNGETNAFVGALNAMALKEPLPFNSGGYPWSHLLENWEQSHDRGALAALAGRDATFSAALARRAARHPAPDWRGFLTAGLENEPALLVSLRSARTGYGVLTLHPDSPVLTDLYVIQENRVVSTFASTLFPAKGWLPAVVLLDRLPAPTTP